MEILITRLDLGEINTAFLLCSNIIDLKKIDGRHKYRIEYSEMQKYCNDKEHKVLLVVVTGVKGTNESKGEEAKKPIAKTKIIAQYVDQGAIILPDGVAY